MTSSKAQADRHQRILRDLLAQPGNDVCADCHAPAPRWASWNLGVFLCVSCATVHRKLGSHISKVKSVTLDTWTKEQVENMKSIGNLKANALYNPDTKRNPPPTNMLDSERDSELEIYIRNKYQYKAFQDRTRQRKSSPMDDGLAPSPRASSSNYRDSVLSTSSTASSLIASMSSHSKKLEARSRTAPPGSDTAVSPRQASFDTKSSEKDMAFTMVGVAPNLSKAPGKARPSTASATTSTSTRSFTIPTVTTTAPASQPVPAPAPAPVTTQPASTPSIASAPAPAPAPTEAKPLWFEDLMAIQNNTPVQPPTTSTPFIPQQLPTNPSLPSTFSATGSLGPTGGRSFSLGATPIGIGGNVSSPLGTGLVMGQPTGVAGMGVVNPFTSMIQQQQPTMQSPFGVQQLQQQQPSIQSPFGIQQQQSSVQSPFGIQQQQPSAQSPFGMQQQPPSVQSPFGMQQHQPGAMQSPFGVQQPQQTGITSPFGIPQTASPAPMATLSTQQHQQPLQSTTPFQPTMLSSSTSPFAGMQPAPSPSPFGVGMGIQPSPSPFMQQPQQQQAPFMTSTMTGIQPSPSPSLQQQPTQQSQFASFAQGMLPKSQQQQQQTQLGGTNPFGAMMGGGLPVQQTGMGMNGMGGMGMGMGMNGMGMGMGTGGWMR